MNKPINNCPSCNSELEWSDTFTDLYCHNINCESQVIHKLGHFFGTINVIDGVGPATLETLTDNGFNTIQKIYSMTYNDFKDCGYLHKTCMNLGTELEKSRERPIPDYRFLAALGIENLGIGNSKKFLEEYEIADIFLINRNSLIRIDGFGSIISDSISSQINKNCEDIQSIFSIGFNITNIKTVVTKSIISGKRLTFSGKMSSNRKEMEEYAKSIGGLITGVNSKSDFLIIGEKVGKNKLDAAKKYNVTVLSENEYMEMINE